jgi:DNA-directed RNA polymerase specialized sigma24 family protein
MIRDSIPPPVASQVPERGDPEAHWTELVERHGERVRSAVRGALRAFGERPDPDRVDDLVQEVWCRLLARARRRRAGPRGEREGETATYLRRVATTVVADVLRAEGAAKRRPRQLLPLEHGRYGFEREPVDGRSCPLRDLLARDRLRRYLALCGELLGRRGARERRRIVRLALVVGLTSTDIARRVGAGWTPSGVDSLMFRLRRRLSARGERLPVRGTQGARS